VLERAAIKTGWAGLYEVSPDNQAIVGESELGGFWLCCGFSGHGFMQAPAVGRLLAAEITGAEREIDIAPFDPARFARGESTPEAAVI
jgi:sarcosine oxidase, subunit beta